MENSEQQLTVESVVEQPIVEQPIVEELIEKLVKQLLQLTAGHGVTSDNIITLAVTLMRIVNNQSDLIGIQKKYLVLAVLRKLTDQTVSDPATRLNIQFVIDTTLPYVIDTLISTVKGNLKIIPKLKKSLMCC